MRIECLAQGHYTAATSRFESGTSLLRVNISNFLKDPENKETPALFSSILEYCLRANVKECLIHAFYLPIGQPHR